MASSELARAVGRKAYNARRAAAAEGRRSELLMLAGRYYGGNLHSHGICSEMATRFAVSRWTVYRDIDALEATS